MSDRVLGWPKATLYGTLVVAVAFLALIEVPDLLVSNLSGMSRNSRVYLASGWFFIALVALLWSLRKLQARAMRK
jgi:hypothetical protein